MINNPRFTREKKRSNNQISDINPDFSNVKIDDYLSHPSQEELQNLYYSGKEFSNLKNIFSETERYQAREEYIAKKYAHMSESYQCISDFLHKHCKVDNCIHKKTVSCPPQFMHCIESFLSFASFGMFNFEKNLYHFDGNDVYIVNSSNADKIPKTVNVRINQEQFIQYRLNPQLRKSILSILKNNNFNYLPIAKIMYGKMLNSIHQNITNYITQKYQSNLYSQSNGNKTNYATRLDKFKISFIQKHFPMDQQEYDSSSSFIVDLYQRTFTNLKQLNSPNNAYGKLYAYSKAICNNSLSAFNQLSILFSKIYTGREFVTELNKENKHCTIIITSNTTFIKSYLKDILSPQHCKDQAFLFPNSIPEYLCFPSNNSSGMGNIKNSRHITEYTSSYLSNKDNIPTFLRDKALGNIVNITDSCNSYDIQIITKLILGELLSITDDITDKLCYHSNTHYIFICQSWDDNIIKDFAKYSDVIDLTKSTLDYVYAPLDFYELFFMITTFIENGIELMEENHSYSSPSEKPVESYLKAFVETYVEKGDESDYIYKQSSQRYPDKDSLMSFFEEYLTHLNFRQKMKFDDFSKFITTTLKIKDGKAPVNDSRAVFLGVKFKKETFLEDMASLNVEQENNEYDTSSMEFEKHFKMLINRHLASIENWTH